MDYGFRVSEALDWLLQNFGSRFTLHEERSKDLAKASIMVCWTTLCGQIFEVVFWRPINWKHDWLISGITRVSDGLEIFTSKKYKPAGSFRQYKLLLVNGELVIAALAGMTQKNLRLSKVFPLSAIIPASGDTTSRNWLDFVNGQVELVGGNDTEKLLALKLRASKVMRVAYDLSPAEQVIANRQQAVAPPAPVKIVRTYTPPRPNHRSRREERVLQAS